MGRVFFGLACPQASGPSSLGPRAAILWLSARPLLLFLAPWVIKEPELAKMAKSFSRTCPSASHPSRLPGRDQIEMDSFRQFSSASYFRLTFVDLTERIS